MKHGVPQPRGRLKHLQGLVPLKLTVHTQRLWVLLSLSLTVLGEHPWRMLGLQAQGGAPRGGANWVSKCRVSHLPPLLRHLRQGGGPTSRARRP